MTMINAFMPDNLLMLPENDRVLIGRRDRVLGPAYRLFYDRPLHVVRGEGVWLHGADGKHYLDAYNNVAVVGHSHPRVVNAIAEQAASLNTHTRYLTEPVLDYAEALLATLPAPIAHVMFTCTGSEANDLALRIVKAATGGRGVIVTANAYHGVTELLAGLSPSLGGGQPVHDFVRTVAPPALDEADGEPFAKRVAQAAEDLRRNAFGPSALLLDTILSSDGVLGGRRGIIAPAVDAIRAAGGIFIADEVQAGLGRVGTDFWGFSYHGVVPDLVTCGKPMGNGYPVAMVAARADLVARFGKAVRYFNTFGGNPVAAAAGLVVLDVLREEDLAKRADATGEYLRQHLSALTGVEQVRGAGLFIGADLASPQAAASVVNRLRNDGVLVSATGAKGDALKIRPPLVFDRSHADLLVQRMSVALRSAA